MDGTAAASQPETKSELARLTGVVWEPGTTFPDIAARPRWWPPLAIVIVLSLVFMYSFSQHVGWDRFMRQQMETNPRMQQLDPAQREQAMTRGAQFAPIMGYVGAVVGFPVMTLIAAGAFLFVFRILLGADLTFRQVFAVYCYALVPTILSSVISLAVLFLKDPDQYDLQNPAMTNIGAFLDPLNTPKWLHSLASSIDVFTIWVLILLATGLAAASRKISWGSSLSAVLGTWVVYVLAKAGWAAMFG